MNKTLKRAITDWKNDYNQRRYSLSLLILLLCHSLIHAHDNPNINVDIHIDINADLNTDINANIKTNVETHRQQYSPSTPRLISTSNAITQTIVALDAESLLVGVDTTSRLSKSLKQLPDIGYRLALSTEGILSLHPTLILLYEGSGPKNVLAQLTQSHITEITIPTLHTLEDIESMAIEIGQAIGKPEAGEDLAQKVAHDADQLNALLSNRPTINTLFIMEEMEGKGSLTLAGRETNADKMMALLKLNNLFASQFSNYKAVSLESQISARPSLVLIGSRQDFDREDRPLFSIRPQGIKAWPTPFQPTCVMEISISDYLIYGIHIYEIGQQLREAIDRCLTDKFVGAYNE